MKKIISIITIFTLISCRDKGDKVKTEFEQIELNRTSENCYTQYKIYTLEGCEYIAVGYGNQRWGSHKGNCKNPIHKNQ